MKEQIRIIIGNKDTGEIYEHPNMGVVETLYMRRRQHREGWVTEASFPSCYASAVRWITENVIAHDNNASPVHEWSVKITIGLNSLSNLIDFGHFHICKHREFSKEKKTKRAFPTKFSKGT